jgi:hypothetical protein
MNRTKQNLLWAALALAIVLGIAWQFYPLADAKERILALPLNGEGFSGQDVPLSEFEKTFFTKVNVLKRVYKIGERYFFVTALDGTRNRHVVHDPYYCFKGSGWEILSDKSFPIPGGTASLLEITKGEDKRQALFWFSDGTSHYTSPLHYWWEATVRRITLGYSGPEPILILIQPLEGGPVDWNNVVKIFHPLFKL